MVISNYRKAPAPSPQGIAQPNLRQILQALLANQDTLFSAISALDSVTTTKTSTTDGQNIVIKSTSVGSLTSSPLTVTLPADADPNNPASIAALANANKGAVQKLIEGHNKVVTDLSAISSVLISIKAQNAEIIKRLNKAG